MSRRTWIVIGVLVLLALPVAWYLISPLFIDKEVDEAFPDSCCGSDRNHGCGRHGARYDDGGANACRGYGYHDHPGSGRVL